MYKRVLSLFLIIVLMFIITGCSKTTHRVRESGFYEYVIVGKTGRFPRNKDDQAIAILNLTESGKAQEVIDIPKTIDGKVVQYLGFRIYKGLMSDGGPYNFICPNLKKMYVHDNIIGIDSEMFYWNENIWDLMICSVDNFGLEYMNNGFTYDSIANSVSGNVYIYKYLYDREVKDLHDTNRSDSRFGEKILPANIAFLNNYSNQVNGGYYRLDNIISESKVPQPPTPERDGYEFMGWFIDLDSTSIWNFDTEIKIETGDEFRLYAGWK